MFKLKNEYFKKRNKELKLFLKKRNSLEKKKNKNI